MTVSARLPGTDGYLPRGAAFNLLHTQAPEILVSGPAGTGKSVACLFKIHLCCDKIPNTRALIVRKTRESLTESALVSFENFVLPHDHPAKKGAQRRIRQSYRYPNGSEIVVAGLDKPGKVMSSEYDLVYVQEAIEVDEAAWEAVTTRLRHGTLGYQQLLADTNPDRPTHWLKRRCDVGRTLLMESRHEDNPLLFDEAGQQTLFARKLNGTGYLDILDALTGPRLQRLRHGRWVQAEGVVYDGWDSAIHLVDRFPIPANWRRFLAIDFGFTNPFVAQWWALDPDDRLYRYREIYWTKRLVEDHAKRILELSKDEPLAECAICDHDAEDRATLEKHLRIRIIPGLKEVSPGIQAVASRLRPAGDAKPRLVLVRGALDERDPALIEAKKPCCTEEEFDSYVWDVRANRLRGEEPLKMYDHGMDAMRYMVHTLPSCTRAWSFGAAPEEDSLAYQMERAGL